MKRFGLIVLMLAAVCALSGTMTSTAMASQCVEVEEAGTGRWNDAQCSKAGGEKKYIGIQQFTAYLGQGQWCAEVESGEVGNWEDPQCSKSAKEGRFVKVRMSGPYWYVGGKQLKQGTKQVKLQSKGVTILRGSLILIKVRIECQNSISEGATIDGQGAFQGQGKGRVTYTQCTVAEPAGCTVEWPITTNQIKSYLAYNPNSKQQKFVTVFEPTEGKVFVEIKFPGPKGCMGVTAAPVTGQAAAEIIPVEKEGQEGLINFPIEPITTVIHEGVEKKLGLVFGEAAKFSGAYGARLATNEQWGVFGTSG